MTPPNGTSDDDDTLAASSDVVAMIRQHAAELRGEAGPTTSFNDEDEVTQPARAFNGQFDHTVPLDDAARRELRSVTIDLSPEATSVEPDSLVQGVPPPVSSTSFWDPTDRTRDEITNTNPVDQQRRFPLWFWIGVAVLVAMVVVAIVIAIATSGGAP